MNRALLAGSVTLGVAVLPVCLIVSGVPILAAQSVAPATSVVSTARLVVGADEQAQQAARTTSKPRGSDTILVSLPAGAANPIATARAAVRDAAAGLAGVKSARQIGTDLVSVTLNATLTADAATQLAKAVAREPGVRAADRSLTFTPAEVSTVGDYQWNLASSSAYGVGAADAWKTTTGLDPRGRTVVVGVVDTGIASNAALPPTTRTQVTAANGAKVVGTTAAKLAVVVTDAAGRVMCDTTADSSGAFTCGPLDPKPADEDVITVTTTDQVGRTSIAKRVVGDATAPDAPVINPSNGTRISGTAEAGALITLTYPDDSTQTTTVGGNGIWSVDSPSFVLADGDEVTATATDANGNVSGSSTITIDKVAPGAPVLEPTQGSIVKGTKEAESFVTITWTDDDGTGHTRILDADEAATWEAVLDPSAKDGTTISVTATDPSGNVSDPGTVKADHTPPAAPTVAPSNGAKVNVSGVEADATPTLVDDGGALVHGTWSDKGSGDWTFTPTVPLTEQDAVFVVLTDTAGNASEPTPVLVDTTAPDKPVISPTSGRVVSGTAEPGSTIRITYFRRGTKVTTTTTDAHGVWSAALDPAAANGRPITVTAADAAGNVSEPATVVVDATPPSAPAVAPSNGRTVSISGVEAGATPSLVDASDVAVPGTWVDGGDGTWTFTPDEPLAEDAGVSVVVTDAADNSCVPVPVRIDTTAPAVPVITTVTSTQLAGTAEVGAKVEVAYTDTQDAQQTADVVADDGSWTVVLNPAAKAGSEVRVTATDTVGNTSEAAAATVPDEPSASPSPSEPANPEPAGAGSDQPVVPQENASAPPTPDTTVDNGTNLVGAVLPGYDFLDGDADPTDSSSGSHGTHVAGIVADSGVGNSPAGAAPAVQIEPLRAMNATSGTMSAVIAAINWGAGTFGDNPYPVDVLNLSIETQDATACPPLLQQAIDNAVNRGVVVVAAAGNYNASIATSAPANCRNVIVATASTASGDRAGYSSWGTSATSTAWLVAAPGGSGDGGVDCTAASCPSWILSQIGDKLVGKAGTSMAAPHVAAVAALLKAANRSLTPAQIARIIRGTATPMHDGCPTAVCGSGIVNAAAAVAKAGDATSVTSAVGVGATVAVTVTGTRQVGAVLTASPLPGATAYTTPNSYQWLRGDGVSDVPIPGETSSSYRITGADFGKYVSVRVTTTLGGSTTTAGKASIWTRGYLAPLTMPTASGTYKVKKTLVAKIGTWSPVTPTSVSYQWYRSGKKIKKATKATYKLTKSDRGKAVKVKVTVSAVGYNTTYAYSASHKIKR